jgi:hypothetical protein
MAAYVVANKKWTKTKWLNCESVLLGLYVSHSNISSLVHLEIKDFIDFKIVHL